MPSQDEQLEELLNGNQESGQDDLSMMTEEEIDRILAANQNQRSEPAADSDLMDLLSGDASDAELSDIYSMLQKDENNEAIDQSIFKPEEDIAATLLEDDEEDYLPPLKRKAAEKERQKEEKKKAKEAAKLAKKEAKEKKKAEKAEKSGKAGKAENSDKTAKPGLFGMFKKSQGSKINLTKESDGESLDQTPKTATQSGDNASDVLMEQQVAEQATEQPTVNLEKKAAPVREAIDETDEIFENMEALDQGLLDSLEKDVHDAEGIIPEKGAKSQNDNSSEEKPTGEKKGLFGKIAEFLFAEDEDDEDEEKAALHLSDENQEILDELDKKDKKKGKKGKKGKKAEKDADEDDEEAPAKDKKKKPKKEKKPKLKPVDDPSEKKLSKKKVILVFAFCTSLCAAIIVLGTIAVDYSNKFSARVAFNKGDYETCYQNLYGKKFLTESQQVMYGKSESILRARLWMREYEIFAEEGSELKALDSLLLSVHDYPKLYSYSEQYDAESEVKEIYDKILKILEEKYHLSEERAKEIGNDADDVEYTKQVKRVLGLEIPSEQGNQANTETGEDSNQSEADAASQGTKTDESEASQVTTDASEGGSNSKPSSTSGNGSAANAGEDGEHLTSPGNNTSSGNYEFEIPIYR